MSTTARQSDFRSTTQDAARKLWEGYTALLASQAEWTAQDYGTTMEVEEGAELLPAAFGAVIFDTANAIKVLMDGGHATNVTNIL